MQPLANKGTRLTIFSFLQLFATLLLIYGIATENAALPSFNQWFEFTRWNFGIYAASEVGGKGAEAYRDRNIN